MIKTKFDSIVTHKFNNQYICYDSSIQPILKNRILASLDSDEFRLSNSSNFLDLNNGLIKKHFYRKGAMYFLEDKYFYYGLKNTRPLREYINHMEFIKIVQSSKNEWIIDKLELCTPIFSYIEMNTFFYTGDIILSKINGETLDLILKKKERFYLEEQLGLCFKFLFNNGVYNFDMNLKNIIFNYKTNKISFIDFDKVMINRTKRNSKLHSSRVISKFRDSLMKHDLLTRFVWKKFLVAIED